MTTSSSPSSRSQDPTPFLDTVGRNDISAVFAILRGGPVPASTPDASDAAGGESEPAPDGFPSEPSATST